MISDKILILDFGSQYTQLIARRIRELKVYCQIHPFNYPLKKIKRFKPKGIILSGGPSSVYSKGAPKISKEIFGLDIPVLGICYGMQIMTHKLGGKVLYSRRHEYGRAKINIKTAGKLFKGVKKSLTVWASHADKVTKIPKGFKLNAASSNCKFAAVSNEENNLYGVQFHPEVTHTSQGDKILKNFVFGICSCQPTWTMQNFINAKTAELKKTVGKNNVILGLSGGVDSSVLAVLLHKAIGNKLKCIFVNNGLLRQNEAQEVIKTFRNNFHIKLIYANAEKDFLSALKNVTEPEKKRKIIGHKFIDIFAKAAKKIKNAKFLAQGTLYPDVIESVSFKGPSATIKTHHNVGGLPRKLHFKLIEPFRELFKDEVRAIGKKLGLPAAIIWRHPFPGPGLAVRVLGKIDKSRLDILRLADEIFITELKKAGLYRKIWQAFAVLLPVKSVGVMGDSRTYENTVVLRAVTSTDGMTADWAKIPNDILTKISNRIINEARISSKGKGINRVTYDISSKPPATIEWE
jgi:GMP synthase (glutamine-hydrolysing)